RAASPGRSSARTQTHALTGSNQAAPENPAPYTSSGSPTRTSVFRRRRTTPRFSSASATTVQAVANDYTSCTLVILRPGSRIYRPKGDVVAQADRRGWLYVSDPADGCARCHPSWPVRTGRLLL